MAADATTATAGLLAGGIRRDRQKPQMTCNGKAVAIAKWLGAPRALILPA